MGKVGSIWLDWFGRLGRLFDDLDLSLELDDFFLFGFQFDVDSSQLFLQLSSFFFLQFGAIVVGLLLILPILLL